MADHTVTRGRQISYSDYMAEASVAWRQEGELPIGTTTSTVYIAAPSFVVAYYINHTGFGTTYGEFDVYKWDGTSTSFPSTAWHSWRPEKGAGSSSSTIRMVHNKDDESYNEHDNSDIHLWKVTGKVYTEGWGGHDCKISFYTGGIEVIPNTSTYNGMWKRGSLLKACNGHHYQSSSYTSEAEFIRQNRPSAYTGGLIDSSNGEYAYSERT